MTESSALSRSPARASVSIDSRSFRASAGERTGVAPLVTTCFGPRTAAAGFTGRTWLTTSQSPSMRSGQVLLHRRGRPGVGPDVGSHVERRDVAQLETSRLAPPEELPHRPSVRRPRPRVRDPPREELQEPRHRRRPRVDDHLRQDDLPSPARHDCRPRGRRRQSLCRHSVTTSPPPTPTQRPTSSLGQVRQLRAQGLGRHLEPDPGQSGLLELGDQARASLLLAPERGPPPVLLELLQELRPRERPLVADELGPEAGCLILR